MVEIARLDLHPRRLVANPLQSEVLDQPDRPPVVEAGDVFAPQQRDGVAEAAAMLVDERLAVRVLLAGHLLEHA